MWVTLWLVTVSELCMCLRHEMCTLKKEKGRADKHIAETDCHDRNPGTFSSCPNLFSNFYVVWKKFVLLYFLVKCDKFSFCIFILPVLFVFWIFFEIVEIIIFFCIFRRNILPFQQFATLNSLYVVIFKLYWHLIPPNFCFKVVKV